MATLRDLERQFWRWGVLATLLVVDATPAWAQVVQQPITPAPGSSAGGEAGAKRTLERSGYKDIKGLRANNDGTWTGRASRNNVEWTITIDTHGNITER